jgi:glycosyltransferase involved in cell wall biosynthesis
LERDTRVLINALSARQGGGQTYLSNLLTYFPEEYASQAFVLAPDSLSLPAQRDNVKKISVNWPVGNPFVRAIWERLQLPRLVRQLNADVLFCPGGIIGSKVRASCKSVTTFQNMIPFDPELRRQYPFGYMRVRNWILKKVLLRSMLRSDLVIFISEYARKVVEMHTNGKLHNVAVIPHGISPAFRKSGKGISERLGSFSTGDYLLYVSTLDHYKAQLEVVQAYALLRKRRDTKEKLVLVGSEYPEYGQKVREKITELGLDNDVLIVGIIPHTDMPGVYQNAALNIFASECENCPNILLEALAAGRPVICSNFPPMPEFAGDAVVYFNPKLPVELAEKMAALLADPSRMIELAEKAVKQSALYDWGSTAKKTWETIRQLTGGTVQGNRLRS